MQQRVQLARVLANQPQVVFMDEPLGALDAQTRAVLQTEIERLWLETRCTIMFITHDLDEALKLADRVVTMNAGPAAGIKSIYKIDQPRPRDETEPSYVKLRKRLWSDISEEVMKTLNMQKEQAQ
jgi:NitT/TauT family transport system ATP-binding protein